MSNYKDGGLDDKYIITKKNGNPVDTNAQYFVLRLDKDPHALVAIEAYAESVKEDNQELSDDLVDTLEQCTCIQKWSKI